MSAEINGVHLDYYACENKIIVKVPYQRNIVSYMRQERGFTYNPENKARELKATKSSIKKVINFMKWVSDQKGLGLEQTSSFAGALVSWQEELEQEKQKEELSATKRVRGIQKLLDGASLPYSLFPYQRQGVEFIERTGGRCLLGDEMGLGKTVQALVWCYLSKKQTLIICPKSLIYNWVSEIYKFTGLQAVVLPDGADLIEDDTLFYVINYDQLSRVEIDLPLDVVIIDECHYIKNPKAQRTKAVLELVKGIGQYILLSGTSIKNRPIEFWTQLHLLDPKLFDDWVHYAIRYCKGVKERFGWNVKGASHLDELHQNIASFYLRRKKEDVLTELPPKLVSNIQTEILVPWKPARLVLEMIGEAKQRAALAKIKVTIDLVETFLQAEEKVVIFSDYIEPCRQISEHFKDVAVYIVQEDDATVRQQKIEKFQDPSQTECQVFVTTIKLGGVGMTLTASSKVIFNDLPWSPADLWQAEDRIHRIGQRSLCNSYRILTNSEIDRALLEQIEFKERHLELVFDGKNNSDMVNEMTPLDLLKNRLEQEIKQ